MTTRYVRLAMGVRRVADGALIPPDEDNADYQHYRSVLTSAPADVVDELDTLPLAALQAAARATIDAEAETARLRYVTPGAGQALTYQDKRAQALAYQAAGFPADATPWPFIAAEAVALLVSPQVAAETIIATSNAWGVVGAAIERIRMGGKRAVTTAPDNAAVIAARDNAINELRAV